MKRSPLTVLLLLALPARAGEALPNTWQSFRLGMTQRELRSAITKYGFDDVECGANPGMRVESVTDFSAPFLRSEKRKFSHCSAYYRKSPQQGPLLFLEASLVDGKLAQIQLVFDSTRMTAEVFLTKSHEKYGNAFEERSVTGHAPFPVPVQVAEDGRTRVTLKTVKMTNWGLHLLDLRVVDVLLREAEALEQAASDAQRERLKAGESVKF